MTATSLARRVLEFGALPAFRQMVYRRSLVTVLCLHRVSNQNDDLAPSLTPALLRYLCRLLARHYRVVRFRDLPEQTTSVGPKPLLVLSFDDGYLDFFENAMPILLEAGLRANLNVITECADSGEPYLWQACIDLLASTDTAALPETFETLGVRLQATGRGAAGLAFTKWFQAQLPPALEALALRLKELAAARGSLRSRMMQWDHVREAHRLGFEIGSHTVSHAPLDSLPPNALEHELTNSKRRLEAELAHPVDVLAFPGGRYTSVVQEAGRRLGYRYLLGTGGVLDSLSPEIWQRILVYGDSETRLTLRASGLEDLLRQNPVVATMAGWLGGGRRPPARAAT